MVGSNNICVYIAFFAKLRNLTETFIVIGIFYIMLVFYIWLGAYIAQKSPRKTETIKQWSPYFIPLLLIGLGCYIFF